MTAQTFTEYSTNIKPEWIDYNKHLNDAAYAQILTLANEAFLDYIGMSAAYRLETGASLYTVDLHITYLAEVHSDATLNASTTIIELNPKKMRLRTELVRNDGVIAAVGTILYVHYDSTVAQVTPLPANKLEIAEQWLTPQSD